MNIEKLKETRTKLKNGEYDGVDIMQAWLAIDKLIELKAQPTPSQSEAAACVTYKQVRSNGATTTDTDLCITPYKSVNELGIGTKLYIKPQPTSQDLIDAERYRFMRETNMTDIYSDYMIYKLNPFYVNFVDLDAAIDAAMKESK